MLKRSKLLLFTLIIFSLVSACKNENNSNTGGEKVMLTNVKVDFANLILPMPSNYKQYTPSEILEEVKRNEENEGIKDIIVSQIQRLEQRSNNYIMLHDPNEISSSIHIEEKPPIELSKATSEMILAQIKSAVKAAYQNSGAQYSFLEQKYFGGKEAQIMKAKFELGLGPFKIWITQYAISARGKAIFVTHATEYPEDIEENIKALKFY